MRASLHHAKKKLASNDLTVVEVGVEHGYNARNILIEWSVARLILVDNNPAIEWLVRHTLSEWDSYDLFIGDTADIAAKFDDGSIDVVYIDDDHSFAGVLKSVKAWAPKVREGGVLCGHDYDMLEVQEAVQELASVHGWKVQHDDIDWWVDL